MTATVNVWKDTEVTAFIIVGSLAAKILTNASRIPIGNSPPLMLGHLLKIEPVN